ncbi:hypothetical protein F7725_027487 [Dissostichus mawsoni]|uniref:Uncharacterized protein n=1 Tax=Dissostichus mawsoni TaxID=36200 RepID=A0A7J5XDY6_DISMA|nr:hypothetical protein F7725_027487 [Dissostichus mawsoni]
MGWRPYVDFTENMEQLPGVSSVKSLVVVFCCIHLSLALQCLNDKEPCVNNATCLTFKNGTEYCSTATIRTPVTLASA